jgi:hypothetical protein
MTHASRTLRTFLWCFVVIYGVIDSLSITQVDLWWQLAEGQHILHTGHLPAAPVAAFGLPAQPYVDEYAGYEVVLAALYQVTGYVGVWVAFSAIFLLCLLVPSAMVARKTPPTDLLSLAALFVAIVLLRTRLEQRPEPVGVLLEALLIALLRASSLERVSGRLLAAVGALFVAWSNCHSTFVIGFATLGLWLADELRRRWSTPPLARLVTNGAKVGAVALLAAMINPYGPWRLLFPFVQAADFGSTALSPEMWAIGSTSPVVGLFYTVTLALLAWAVLVRRSLPLWLIGYAALSAVIAYKSYRFVDLVALALLFAYAAPREEAPPERRARGIAGALLNVSLAGACVFVAFLDGFAAVMTYHDARDARELATYTRRFAPELVERLRTSGQAGVPILCGHGTGSYVSFAEHGPFHPLIDSGLSHFSDETKRYFFFAWYESAAFDLAVDQLHVDHVLVTRETFNWLPVLHRKPEWRLVACSVDGALWERTAPVSPALDPAMQAEVRAAIAAQQQEGNSAGAFFYSLLLDRPGDSLALLAAARGLEWTEPRFNAMSDWLDALPLADVQAYYASPHELNYPLVDAMVAARLGPEVYDRFIQAPHDGPRPWYWHAVEVRVRLAQGRRDEARAALDRIAPVPDSSTLYYHLWHQVHDTDAAPAALGAYGRWQSWELAGPEFMTPVAARLNARAAEAARLP